MMRYFLNSEISQPDSKILQSQIIGYAAHLQLIFEFFESIQNNSQLDKKSFEKNFDLK